MSPKNTTLRTKGEYLGRGFDDRDIPATINAAATPALYGRGSKGEVTASQIIPTMINLIVAHIESRPPAR